MYVVTGIWLHTCKCMVDCRLGNYFGSHFEVDGWDDEVYWSAWERKTEISSEGCNMIEHEAVILVSLHFFTILPGPTVTKALRFAWFGFRLVGLTIHPRFQAMTTARALEKAPKMPRLEKNSANESQAVFGGLVTALMMPAFWMVMILWERKGDREQKKSRHINVYIYIYTYWATTVPCWPFFHYSNWKSSLEWQVIPWKRHSTKSHAANQSQFSHAACRVWFEACLRQMPYLWPNGTLQLQLGKSLRGHCQHFELRYW